ncbi:MAG TPA: helix-turn-helix domain-containing protein [Gemmataceae bacterium]|nr:helix-turn-helix domain-containing protein [Gemmataceae bacterium]
MPPDAITIADLADRADLDRAMLARGLTVRDVAKRYRVSPERVRGWIRRGELAALNTADRRLGKPRLVVTPEALERFERGRQATTEVKVPHRRTRRAAGVIDFYPG